MGHEKTVAIMSFGDTMNPTPPSEKAWNFTLTQCSNCGTIERMGLSNQWMAQIVDWLVVRSGGRSDGWNFKTNVRNMSIWSVFAFNAKMHFQVAQNMTVALIFVVLHHHRRRPVPHIAAAPQSATKLAKWTNARYKNIKTGSNNFTYASQSTSQPATSNGIVSEELRRGYAMFGFWFCNWVQSYCQLVTTFDMIVFVTKHFVCVKSSMRVSIRPSVLSIVSLSVGALVLVSQTREWGKLNALQCSCNIHFLWHAFPNHE